ncbi:MAG: hypothetical protein AB1485_01640, partial [Candidatus Thermoplasmatota archaeon]
SKISRIITNIVQIRAFDFLLMGAKLLNYPSLLPHDYYFVITSLNKYRRRILIDIKTFHRTAIFLKIIVMCGNL